MEDCLSKLKAERLRTEQRTQYINEEMRAGAPKPGATGASAQSLTTLYSFSGSDGRLPSGDLIADATGALYGTTQSGGGGGRTCAGSCVGTVFKLTPPPASGGPWTLSTLHTFDSRSDGIAPEFGVIADASGALYGTTLGGGPWQSGTVFKLTPPGTAGEAWTFSTLHTFTGGSDGKEPRGSLIVDASGALYGTTFSGGRGGTGTVFKLTPPSTTGKAWTLTTLYSFPPALRVGCSEEGCHPQGRLIADASGALFGTTIGTVFKLTPPSTTGGTWTLSTLHTFDSRSDGTWPNGLIADASGALFGTTYGSPGLPPSLEPSHPFRNGTVFKLTPPSTAGEAWTLSTLYTFTGGSDGLQPNGSLVADASGALYGTTTEGRRPPGGTVFKLAPPPLSGGPWTLSTLHTFTGGSDAGCPRGGVIVDSTGALYGTTVLGGSRDGGTVFKLTVQETSSASNSAEVTDEVQPRVGHPGQAD